MTFAAAICDADDSCSVNTAQDPESFFTISSRSKDVDLCALKINDSFVTN